MKFHALFAFKIISSIRFRIDFVEKINRFRRNINLSILYLGENKTNLNLAPACINHTNTLINSVKPYSHHFSVMKICISKISKSIAQSISVYRVWYPSNFKQRTKSKSKEKKTTYKSNFFIFKGKKTHSDYSFSTSSKYQCRNALRGYWSNGNWLILCRRYFCRWKKCQKFEKQFLTSQKKLWLLFTKMLRLTIVVWPL